MPEFSGSMIRGLFGKALRRTACVTAQPDCKSCPLRQNCVYTYLFEPLHYADNAQNRQPPLIFHVHTIQKRYKKGGLLNIEFSLVGDAIKHIPFVIQSWKRAGRYGFKSAGENNYSRFEFENLYRLDSNNGWVAFAVDSCLTQMPPMRQDILPQADRIKSVTLEFITPYRSKIKGHLITPKTFSLEDFLHSLIRRINGLIRDYQGLSSTSADTFESDTLSAIQLIAQQLQWHDWIRKSSRQATTMNMGGVIGSITFRGEQLQQLMPYLLAGEKVHAGKNCIFGLGAYQLTLNGVDDHG